MAINDNLDILVTYMADRTDKAVVPGLQQVEVSFFEYVATDTWEHRETQLVGSIDYNPLSLGGAGLLVRCDYPDVIAVRDKFFVVWTRTYHASTTGADHEPSILECAWIDIVPGSPNKVMEITAVAGSPGRGFPLHTHQQGGLDYFTLECEGVADAVPLTVAADPLTLYRAAVVYPHQETFYDEPPGSTTRSFDLRMIACTFDTSVIPRTITPDLAPTVLKANMPFNGDNNTVGVLLPDAAPSGEDNAFWVTAEAQVELASGELEGIIGVGYWKYEFGGWNNQSFQSFRSPAGSNFLRRRPMITSYPEGAGTQRATLTYGIIDPDAVLALGKDTSANTELRSLNVTGGTMSVVPYGSDWPNTSALNVGKSVVASGRSSAGIRFCLADEAGVDNPLLPIPPCQLQAWNQTDGTMETLVSFPPPGPLGRPAVDYVFDTDPLNLSPDYLAVTWEQINPGTSDPLRVHLGVMEQP